MFDITVYEELDNKRKRIRSTEIHAKDDIQALEKACIRLRPGRIIEIRETTRFDRPPVTRVSRDGI
jgi:hypothetical protein